jgi:Cu(I)/Ag(I) efflux system membrane fusion protein/cobalt-zinc-cadmium efflux system membrane fusion protein
MKSPINKKLQMVFFTSALLFLLVITACSQDNKKSDHDTLNMSKEKIDSSIVRSGTIDLIMIDKNKDGMVYQDMMDWNVISDEPGKCPLCGMILKEVSLEEAKENLIKHDYKLKEN